MISYKADFIIENEIQFVMKNGLLVLLNTAKFANSVILLRLITGSFKDESFNCAVCHLIFELSI